MRRFLTAVAALLMLLMLYSPATAGSDNDPAVIYDIDTVLGNWGVDRPQWDGTVTRHQIWVETGTYTIQTLYMTIFIPSTTASTELVTGSLIPGLDSTLTATADGGHYRYFKWTFPSGQQFSARTAIAAFDLSTVACPTAGSFVEIRFTERHVPGLDWRNSVVDNAFNDHDATPNPGAQGNNALLADIGVKGHAHDLINPYIADEGYVGETGIAVPLYLRDINFRNTYGFDLTVQFSDQLDYTGFQLNVLYYWTVTDSENGTQVHLHSNSGLVYSGTYDGDVPAEDAIFGYLYFTILPTATEGAALPIQVVSPATFTACNSYAYTDNSNADIAYVRVSVPTVSLRFATTSVQRQSAPFTWGYPVEVLTNVPLMLTGAAGKLKFTFDNTAHFHDQAPYLGPLSPFAFGSGYTYWARSDDYPPATTVLDNEGTNEVNIPASAEWQTFEKLNVSVGTVAGVDTFKFMNGANYPNYVTVAYNGAQINPPTLIDGKLTITNPPPNNGCPELSVWTGSAYTQEDHILTHSQTTARPTSQDEYLPLNYTPALEHGSYRLQIAEKENEITYLDEVQLIAVDHPVGTTTAVSTKGEVVATGAAIAPISAVTDDGIDILALVRADDGLTFQAHRSGSMILTYPPTEGAGRQNNLSLSLASQPKPPRDSDPLARISGESNVERELFAEVETTEGIWQYIGTVPPRKYSEENAVCLIDAADLRADAPVRIRVSWRGEYSVDCQDLRANVGGALTEHRLYPSDAIHSVAGKVGPPLANANDAALILQPGQQIELSFAAPSAGPQEGYQRSFFFRSRGYYVGMKGSDLPASYELGDNHPNPFNPSTTIELSLPVAGDVSLVVFNVLGQEVKTLVNGPMDAGRHQVIWNGDDNDGNRVASGVYLYRMTAGSYTTSKKMTLIK